MEKQKQQNLIKRYVSFFAFCAGTLLIGVVLSVSMKVEVHSVGEKPPFLFAHHPSGSTFTFRAFPVGDIQRILVDCRVIFSQSVCSSWALASCVLVLARKKVECKIL